MMGSLFKSKLYDYCRGITNAQPCINSFYGNLLTALLVWAIVVIPVSACVVLIVVTHSHEVRFTAMYSTLRGRIKMPTNTVFFIQYHNCAV